MVDHFSVDCVRVGMCMRIRAGVEEESLGRDGKHASLPTTQHSTSKQKTVLVKFFLCRSQRCLAEISLKRLCPVNVVSRGRERDPRTWGSLESVCYVLPHNYRHAQFCKVKLGKLLRTCGSIIRHVRIWKCSQMSCAANKSTLYRSQTNCREVLRSLLSQDPAM